MRPTLLLLIAAAAVGGESSAVLKDASGQAVITYLTRLPAKPSGARPGLVLIFHGRTHNETTFVGPAQAALERAGIAGDYVLCGLKSKGVGWETVDEAPVEAFAAFALAEYRIDPRRVVAMGFSSGAWFAARFVPPRPALMAGAICYVGGQPGLPKVADPASAPPLYWAMGHKDTLQPLAEPRQQALAALAAGFPVVYREDREMGHDFLRPPTGDDALAWMPMLRTPTAPLAPDEQDFIARYADADQAKRLFGDAKAWTRLVAIGGAPVRPVLLQGLAHEKEGVRANAATACAHVQVDAPLVAALAALLDGKETKPRAAALAALARHAGWNDGPAQDALCAWLDDERKRQHAERRAVVQALAGALRLDAAGACICRRGLWRLVDCLDDDDAAVRQLAFQTLQGAVVGGFGYQPEAPRPARRPAVEQWLAWAEKTCGARAEK